MRIISGAYRGKILKAKNYPDVRPTTDFAKSGLFNILNNRVEYEELDVLDLFAGIGNISLEFVSRGCKSVTSVEINRKNAGFIMKTAKEMQADNIEVIARDSYKYLYNCGQTFDLIFADPPFDDPKAETLLSEILENKLLNENGIFILEHRTRSNIVSSIPFDETRKYGEVSFGFYTLNCEL